ncbi:MAG: glycoside hydrolase family 6 protein, partial [Ktedonobacteraceae bacterium]|nr:glycoside hydrolase family 6 protein [Ktedonobacteraceae bacterium]
MMHRISGGRLRDFFLKRKLRSLVLLTSALILIIGSFFVGIGMQITHAASYCQVTYTVTNQWPGGFGANIVVQNTSSAAWTSWNLTFAFPASGQAVTQGWNGTFTQSGQNVSVVNMSWNGNVAVNGTVNPGFNGSWTSSNPIPTSFSVNGNVCNGSTTGTPTPTATGTPAGTPTSTPTNTPTPTPTGTPIPGTHVPNPYAGADGYVNPDWAAEVRAGAAATGGTLGQQEARVAQYPTAVWLDRIAAVTGGSGVTRTLAGHLDAALAQDAANGSSPVVITIVVYDLPNRDCAALASNGELLVAQDGLNKYKTQYIDPIVATLSQAKYSNLRIAAIIEPDSLPNLVTNLSMAKCSEANSSGAYVQGVQYALGKLHAITNVYNYVDIAHSGWLGWSSNFGPAVNLIGNTIKGAVGGVNSVDGFISNTANYTPTSEPFMTATQTVGGQQVRSANFYQFNDYIDEATYATAMRNAFISAG